MAIHLLFFFNKIYNQGEFSICPRIKNSPFYSIYVWHVPVAKLNRIGDALGKPILQTNSYRMSYGDLNYLGLNKAIFYFDRGIRGKQIFNNSMYTLEQQP